MTTRGQREVDCGVEMLFAPGAKSISTPQSTSRAQQPCALGYGYGLWHASIFKNISDPHYTVIAAFACFDSAPKSRRAPRRATTN